MTTYEKEKIETDKKPVIDVLADEVFASILDLDDEVAKERVKQVYREEAKRQGKLKLFEELYKAFKKENDKINKPIYPLNTQYGDMNSAYIPEFIYRGKNILKIKHNMNVLLNMENISVKYNETTKKVEFTGINHLDYAVDATYTNIRDLCILNDFNVSEDNVYKFIYALGVENKYNPVAEYLNRCKENTDIGEDEINKLLDTIHFNGIDTERVKFVRKMMLKWLLNCVHIAFNELSLERTCEIVPTFMGEQGKGKSRWCRSIVPHGLFKGNAILNLKDKDSIADVLAYWIVELGEVKATFNKSDNDMMKAFITADNDTWRSPYARSVCKYSRRTTFIATVNDETFLTDKTGNRRYFVVPAHSLDYIHDVDIDRLWGELMHLYDAYITSNIPIYMTQDEQAQNEIYNKGYVTKTDTEIALDDVFDWDSDKLGACKIAWIVKYLKDNTGKVYSENAIKSILKHHNAIYAKFTAGRANTRSQDKYWKVPFVDGLTLPF